MKVQDLINEITAVIEARIAADEPVGATWVTHEVVSRHSQPEHADSGWYTLCAYEAVRGAVRTVARNFRRKSEEDAGADEQQILPGFERVQKAYLVERDGEQRFVPTASLTDEEIDAKSDQLECIGEGCFQHAKELRRYKKERVRVVAAVRRRGGT